MLQNKQTYQAAEISVIRTVSTDVLTASGEKPEYQGLQKLGDFKQ